MANTVLGLSIVKKGIRQVRLCIVRTDRDTGLLSRFDAKKSVSPLYIYVVLQIQNITKNITTGGQSICTHTCGVTLLCETDTIGIYIS